MDNLRLILVLGFVCFGYLLWDAWQQDYGPQPISTVSQSTQPSVESETGLTGEDEGVPELSTDSTPIAMDTDTADNDANAVAKTVEVTTDLLRVQINTIGADIRVVDLLAYPVSMENPNEPTRLLDFSNQKLFISQTGLINNDKRAPTHHSIFHADKDSYSLADGQDSLTVELTWQDNGISVTKRYTFTRGSYLIKLEQTLDNQSESAWKGAAYQQLQQIPPEDENGGMFIQTYTGGVVYSEAEKYEKVSFDDMQTENTSIKTTGGWTAMIQHYFLAAWIPPADSQNTLYTKSLSNDRYIIGSYGTAVNVAPGSQASFTSALFTGPKLQHKLEAISPGLELTVDYGILTVIGKPIFWLLEMFHSLFSNWGMAIIFTTLIIKLMFFPLSAASYRSMANMRKLQPRLAAIRERCGDDKQKLNQQMMEMYRKEKINPLGGCLPIVLQIPVFISLYWVLIESVELRQAPFILWINDLSSMDPYFVLPVFMGISMFVQQSLNPAPVDPIQAKVMKLFPWIFTVFFAFFPAGLVLYWVVNNVLSILQQWYITRQIEAGSK